jgi:hypothetical protein
MSKSDKRENIIVVASEPLTFEKGRKHYFYLHISLNGHFAADWMEIRTNTMIVITPKMVNISILKPSYGSNFY